ncbi:hypothetical protein [Pseudomonas sp. MONT-RG-20F-20-E-7-02]|uniref:hypothetical protein n=1 Tax=Pseudomonas sp. MONT-RG-20F-20-E-7-02 TaxID=2914979 RepID=UPI001F5ACA41|nr:hypothetical protein [Pseudomonas sp. MONT-RG-20F-20-E-7-02]
MANFSGVSNVASDSLSKIEKIMQTITPASVAAATAAEQTFTVPGLQLGDFVDVTPPGITAGVTPSCARVSALNTLAITFINPTAGALTPLAGVYQIQLNR